MKSPSDPLLVRLQGLTADGKLMGRNQAPVYRQIPACHDDSVSLNLKPCLTRSPKQPDDPGFLASALRWRKPTLDPKHLSHSLKGFCPPQRPHQWIASKQRMTLTVTRHNKHLMCLSLEAQAEISLSAPRYSGCSVSGDTISSRE